MRHDSVRTPVRSGARSAGVVVAVLRSGSRSRAGWVDADGDRRRRRPRVAAAARGARRRTEQAARPDTVNQIYEHDGRASPSSRPSRPAQPASPFNPFGAVAGGGTATGSGFVIDTDGHILTNNHVVAGRRADRRSSSATRTTDLRRQVVGTDPATDVALLKVDAPPTSCTRSRSATPPRSRSATRWSRSATRSASTAPSTSGIVSALQRQIQAPNGFSISNVIQTDAAINPGNSGGPLIDAAGRVIGINSQIETGGGGSGNVGIGFAIPINTAREWSQQLEANGKVEHAYLGITGGDDRLRPRRRRSTCRSTRACWSSRSSRAARPTRPGSGRRHLGDDRRRQAQRSAATSSPRSTARRSSGMDDVVNVVDSAKPGDTTRSHACCRGRLDQDRHGHARRPAEARSRPPPRCQARCRRRNAGPTRRSRRARRTLDACGSRSAESPTSTTRAEAVRLGAWAIGLIHYDAARGAASRPRRPRSAPRSGAGARSSASSSTRRWTRSPRRSRTPG